MTTIWPMACGSLIVNNKIIEISKLLEECGLSRPPCSTFARYLPLVAATGLLSAVPIPLHWTFWDDLLFVGRRGALEEEIVLKRRVVGSTPALAVTYRDLGQVLNSQLLGAL